MELIQGLGQIVPLPTPTVPEPLRAVAVDPDSPIVSALIDHPGMKLIIEEYVQDLPDAVAELLDLLDGKDFQPLRSLVHRIRGCGGGYGFDAISELAGHVENSIVKSGSRESIRDQTLTLINVIRRTQGYDQTRVAA